MHKCADDRFQSASDVATLLQGCLAHVQDASIPLPSEVQRITPGGRILRHKFIVTLAAVSMVIGLGYTFLPSEDRGASLQQQGPAEKPSGLAENATRASERPDRRTDWHDDTNEQLKSVRDRILRLRAETRWAEHD